MKYLNYHVSEFPVIEIMNSTLQFYYLGRRNNRRS